MARKPVDKPLFGDGEIVLDDKVLADELLLGEMDKGDDGEWGWYVPAYKFLRPGSERELAARHALARLLLKEAPSGRYVNKLAEILTGSPWATQKIEFKRFRGRTRRFDLAAAKLDSDIIDFLVLQLEKCGKLDAAIAAAVEHFGIKEWRVKKVWGGFSQEYERFFKNKEG